MPRARGPGRLAVDPEPPLGALHQDGQARRVARVRRSVAAARPEARAGPQVAARLDPRGDVVGRGRGAARARAPQRDDLHRPARYPTTRQALEDFAEKMVRSTPGSDAAHKENCTAKFLGTARGRRLEIRAPDAAPRLVVATLVVDQRHLAPPVRRPGQQTGMLRVEACDTTRSRRTRGTFFGRRAKPRASRRDVRRVRKKKTRVTNDRRAAVEDSGSRTR